MVLDIEKYPEFVPWCIKGKINEKNESERFNNIQWRFKSRKEYIK